MIESFPRYEPHWTAVGWTMIHFLWSGAVLWLVATGARRITTRCSPRARYAWALVFLAAFPVLAAAITARAVTEPGASSAALDSELPSAAALPPIAPAPLEWSATDAMTTAMSFDAPRNAEANVTGERSPAAWLSGIAIWLPWLWICGTPVVATLFVTGLVGTSRLRTSAARIDDPAITASFERLRASLAIGRRVVLAVSERINSPLVVGIVRPAVLLPPSLLSGLSPQQLEMILLHELAHVRRCDNLINLVQRCIESCLFYHPAVWWTSRWVRLEREHCCDAVVLARTSDPQAYAETLATLALPELSPRFAVATLAGHQLVSRIRHILKVEEHSMGVSKQALVGGAVGLAAAIAIGIFGIDRAVEQSSSQASEPALEVPADDQVAEESFQLVDGAAIEDDYSVQAGTVRSRVIAQGYEPELVKAADWSPQQATGAPNVSADGDDGRAWASLTADGQTEWLTLSWSNPVRAAALVVHESRKPGALVRVEMLDTQGNTTVWEGVDPVQRTFDTGVIPIPRAPVETVQVAMLIDRGVAVIPVNAAAPLKQVKLFLDSPAVPGWNKIDAVGLIDANTGVTHWADGAEASSTFAERAAAHETEPRERIGGTRAQRAQRIEALRAELAALEARAASENDAATQSDQPTTRSDQPAELNPPKPHINLRDFTPRVPPRQAPSRPDDLQQAVQQGFLTPAADSRISSRPDDLQQAMQLPTPPRPPSTNAASRPDDLQQAMQQIQATLQQQQRMIEQLNAQLEAMRRQIEANATPPADSEAASPL